MAISQLQMCHPLALCLLIAANFKRHWNLFDFLLKLEKRLIIQLQ